jgi:hypothetical protein
MKLLKEERFQICKIFPINFAQSCEISSSQYLQKCWQISGVHFKIDSNLQLYREVISYKTPVPFQLDRCFFLHYPCYIVILYSLRFNLYTKRI